MYHRLILRNSLEIVGESAMVLRHMTQLLRLYAQIARQQIGKSPLVTHSRQTWVWLLPVAEAFGSASILWS